MKVENAESVLENLLSIGAITEDQVRSAEGFSPEEMSSAAALHTVFCRRQHGKLSVECGFYEGASTYNGKDKMLWLSNMRALCVMLDIQSKELVEKAAGIAMLVEAKGPAFRVLMSALLTVTEEFTLADFLDSATSEAPEQIEQSGTQESSGQLPQTQLPLREETSSGDLGKQEPESQDPAEPHQATSDGSESPESS